MEWIIIPIIWSFMIGGVIVKNEQAEKQKIEQKEEGDSYEHGV